MYGMTEHKTEYTLAILPHDGTASVVAVSPHDKGSEYVWVTFGEITPNGFSPCYACIAVKTDSLRGVGV